MSWEQRCHPGRVPGLNQAGEETLRRLRRRRGQEWGEVEWSLVVSGVRTILEILSSNSGPDQVKTSQECGEVERAPAQSPRPAQPSVVQPTSLPTRTGTEAAHRAGPGPGTTGGSTSQFLWDLQTGRTEQQECYRESSHHHGVTLHTQIISHRPHPLTSHSLQSSQHIPTTEGEDRGPCDEQGLQQNIIRARGESGIHLSCDVITSCLQ